MTVENAFGRLKGRWRCLLKRNDSLITNVMNVVAACVVLHNVCEVCGDECNIDWIIQERLPPRGTSGTAIATTISETAAGIIQDALRESLYQQ